jgi:hypothetical protein
MKLLVMLALTVVSGAGYFAFGQQAGRGMQFGDSFQMAKPVKRWRYCTLSERRLDNDRISVWIEGTGTTAVLSGGWIEAAETLGRKLAPEYPRKNDPWSRQLALDQMGEMGWELVSVHRGVFEETVWVLKREG